MNFGQYPPDYNRAIHGPYDPARFYGKPDIPFGEVKVGEIGAWFGRREKTPRALAGAISRAFWRWQHAYVFPKRGGIAPVVQVACASMALFYYLNYSRIKHHKNYKHH